MKSMRLANKVSGFGSGDFWVLNQTPTITISKEINEIIFVSILRIDVAATDGLPLLFDSLVGSPHYCHCYRRTSLLPLDRCYHQTAADLLSGSPHRQ
ncbi:hypothetical protein L1887_38636 [Cichorium endivia]|nr:hypothetical protein L1887_38636 [Cichorium endivia]